VVDVRAVVCRQLDELAEAEVGIAGGSRGPKAVPLRKALEEEAKHGRLQLVEARVVADQLEVDLGSRAVEAKQADALAERLVRHRHQPAVAQSEEVLRREEAEG